MTYTLKYEPLTIHLSDETYKFIKSESKNLGRSMEDLAQCAVEEYCLDIMKNKRVSK
jgi:hypothetical protein